MTWTPGSLRDAIHRQLSEGFFIVVSNREPYIHSFEGEDVIYLDGR